MKELRPAADGVLRTKLYKALPQELMPVPCVELPKNKPPPRQSAIKARENLRQCSTIALETSKRQKPYI